MSEQVGRCPNNQCYNPRTRTCGPCNDKVTKCPKGECYDPKTKTCGPCDKDSAKISHKAQTPSELLVNQDKAIRDTDYSVRRTAFGNIEVTVEKGAYKKQYRIYINPFTKKATVYERIGDGPFSKVENPEKDFNLRQALIEAYYKKSEIENKIGGDELTMLSEASSALYGGGEIENAAHKLDDDVKEAKERIKKSQEDHKKAEDSKKKKAPREDNDNRCRRSCRRSCNSCC